MLLSLKTIRAALAVTVALASISFAAPASARISFPPPPPPPFAGLLILEGSDAQTFHRLDPYSTDFLNGMATFSTASALPIAVLGFDPVGTPTVGKVALGGIVPDLATMLADYSGIYVDESSSCCLEPNISAADAATIKSFLGAGRSVAIENYLGGAQFDSIIGNTGPGAGLANSHVVGLYGGFSSPRISLGCFEGNIVAPGGAAYGLGAVGSPVPNLGCFGHQAYQASFFDSLGLTTYIVSAPPDTLGGFNVIISNSGSFGCGLACVVGTPEPSAIAVYGIGVAALALIPGIGTIRRRRQNRKA